MTPRYTETQIHSTFILSQHLLSQAHLSCSICPWKSTHPNTHHPSISPPENSPALIEHLSVYRSTLPIGFWINRIIFLIKQDRPGEGGGDRKGGWGFWVSEDAAEDQILERLREGCWRMRWQNNNLEKEGGWGGNWGSKQEKSQCQME